MIKNDNGHIDLSISIVNYNVTDLVINLIDSIYKSGYAKNHVVEFLVVDNNSTDHGNEIVKYFPDVKLIQNKKNQFFTKADNQNFKRSKGNFILSVNPDVILEPSAIEILIDFIEKNKNVGAVAPKLRLPDGKSQPTISKFVTKKFAMMSVLGIKNNFFSSNCEFNNSNKPYTGEVLCGACILVTRDTLNEFGLKDENLVHGWDEYDWCRRMTEKGKVLYCLPDAIAIHSVGVSAKKMISSKKGKSLMEKLNWDGFFYLYKKHYSLFFYVILKMIFFISKPLSKPLRILNKRLRDISS